MSPSSSPTPPVARRSLILGAAVGYRWAQIAPFVRSLRDSGCQAEVVLLVGRIDEATRRGFSEHAITALPVHRVVTRLPPHIARKRFNRRWVGWLHRALPRLVGASEDPASARNALLARTAAWFHHPACSRYFAYYRYLRPRAGRYDLVLTTDVRDVLFQADPFAPEWRPPGGVLFLEHEATHGHEPGNDMWVDMGFGAEGRAALQGRRVTCSGLTLAPAALMLAYLASMTREIACRTSRLSGHDGVDQGVHNWLHWTGRLPGFSLKENFEGPVLTMHGMPGSLLHADPRNRLVDPAGRVIPVLHQYDRHPALAHLWARYLET